MKILAGLLCLFFSFNVWACFENASSLQAHSYQNYLKTEKIEYGILVNSLCKELDEPKNFEKLTAANIYRDTQVSKLEPLLNLQNDKLKAAYKKELEDVKKKTTFQERLQAAYELSAYYFGAFDFSSAQFTKNENLARMKSADQRRNALLALTLLQARKSESEYQVSIITTYPEQPSQRRQWVRLEIPVEAKDVEKNKTEKNYVDLDPAITGVKYMPLVQRHTGLPEDLIETMQLECVNLKNCLLKKKEVTAK